MSDDTLGDVLRDVPLPSEVEAIVAWLRKEAKLARQRGRPSPAKKLFEAATALQSLGRGLAATAELLAEVSRDAGAGVPEVKAKPERSRPH